MIQKADVGDVIVKKEDHLFSHGTILCKASLKRFLVSMNASGRDIV
jgi:hypothetical protein